MFDRHNQQIFSSLTLFRDYYLRNLLKILTVSENKRRVGRVEDPFQGELIKKYCRGFGLKTYEYRDKVSHNFSIFFSKEKKYIEQVIHYHYFCDSPSPSGASIDLELGHLYGYPDCCIKTFIENKEMMIRQENFELSLKVLLEGKRRFLPVYTNNFHAFTPIFHNVHSYCCPASVKMAKDNLAVIKEYSKSLFETLIKELRLAVLISDKGQALIKDFSYNDTEIKISPSVGISREYRKVLASFKRREDYVIKFNEEKIKIFIFCLK